MATSRCSPATCWPSSSPPTRRDGNAVTVLTAVLDDATGYGRILRAADGHRRRASASTRTPPAAEREIREVNSGIYAFDAAVLRDALVHVTTDNAQGEKYLTDVLAWRAPPAAASPPSSPKTAGRSRAPTTASSSRRSAPNYNRRTVEAWMRAGVTVVDPATTWIDATVTLDEDVRLLPNTQLHGATTVAATPSSARTPP